MEGIHQAPLQGIPASGQHVRVDAISIFRIKDEQIAETWLSADFLGLMQQVGAVPISAQS